MDKMEKYNLLSDIMEIYWDKMMHISDYKERSKWRVFYEAAFVDSAILAHTLKIPDR